MTEPMTGRMQLDFVHQELAAARQEIERLTAALSWITGACVDELPHAEISAAIDRALEPTND